MSYSIVGNAAFGGTNGNIAADPQFVNVAGDDYHVKVGSPAIDAGNPTDSYAKEPQPNGCRINMGAYGNTSTVEASSDPDGDGIFGVCPLQTDLQISISVSPEPVLLNGTVSYTVTVINIGPSVASGITLSGLPGCTLSTTTLAKAVSTSCSIGVTATTVGTLTRTVAVIGAQTDPVTANNSATANTTVVAPELLPMALSVTSSGTNLLINDSVKNQGTAAAASFDVSYYLSSDTVYQSSDALVCKRTVGGLAVNASSPASGTTQTSCAVPGAVSTGNYYVISRVDSSAAVWESNEANNDRSVTTPLGVGPDLTPTAISASRSGSRVMVAETAKNQGNRNISGVTMTMRYYLSTDTAYGSGDIALASSSSGSGTCQRSLSTLSAGATSSISNLTCYKPSAARNNTNYYVLVVDDALNAVTEYTETNNSRATSGTLRW